MVQPKATSGELKVIRWFFGVFFAVAIGYLGFVWLSRERACDASCAVAGRGEGHVVLAGRNRLELSSHCECASAPPE